MKHCRFFKSTGDIGTPRQGPQRRLAATLSIVSYELG